MKSCGTKQSADGKETESDVGSQPFDWRSENMQHGAGDSGLSLNRRRDKLVSLSGQANIIKRRSFVT